MIEFRRIVAGVLLLLLGLFAAAAQESGTGTITGTLYDAKNGQPIPNAAVEIAGQPETKTSTTSDGTFKLAVPAGSYALKATANRYLPAEVHDITVKAGEVVDASTVMALATDVTTVDVVEKINAVAATAEAMVAERRLAPVVSDAISSQEIRNSTASDAAAALEKVTGVSIVDGGYVYVRGLGERYSATMLNNALIPTTEPERRVVPLDLFPAALIENVKVLKTYTPDLPGEFSGGLVQMQTVEFPNQRTFRVGMSYGFNTRTTFDRFDSYRGGAYDFFGFDDGSRGMPSLVPRDQRLFPGSFSAQEFERFGEAFSQNWEPRRINSMRPEQSYSLVGGDTFGPVGLVGAMTFSNRPQKYSELQRYLANAGGGQPVVRTEYPDFVADQESARLGGVLNAALRLSPANKLVFRNTMTRETDKEARTFYGYSGSLDTYIESQRLRWVERGLFSTGLEGDHSFQRLGNSLLKWQFTYSASKRDEPDLREVIRSPNFDGSYAFIATPQSGQRFFNGLEDRIYEPLVEWSTPFYKGSFSGLFKVGFRGTFRDRNFEARRFRWTPVRTSTLDFNQPSNELFGPDNIRPDGFVIRENTRGTDTYDARLDIYGGFALVDLALGPRWRVIGGVRYEDASMRVRTIDPLIPGAVPSLAQLDNRDPLPGVNVIYALTPRQNLRFGYGRTLSRPDFRELSPFDFTNVLGGFNVTGNPNLRRAKIDNFDARWEWFLGGDQLLAASFFHKEFDSPIEVTIQPTTGDLRQTFLNAEGARNSGLELEFRRGLGFLSARLAQFALLSNFTFVDSDVRIGESQRNLLTSLERPLVGQSRYVANVILDWMRPTWRSHARFFANHTSRRISDVGSIGLPDIYQEGNTFMDFVYQFDIKEGGKWSLKFSAENLGDNHYHWTQGGILQRSYYLGRTFNVGTSFSIF
ncbi:MAG: TonB-dependent receptor [Bryobacteraceae bacterium]|nr:TonB-dependent receptor [Bryobacteraceae bacterium]